MPESPKDELLDSLDFEIQQINADRSIKGWTPWLLGSAFGALVWTFLGELKDNPPDLNRIELSFVSAALTLAGLISLKRLIDVTPGTGQSPSFIPSMIAHLYWP